MTEDAGSMTLKYKIPNGETCEILITNCLYVPNLMDNIKCAGKARNDL